MVVKQNCKPKAAIVFSHQFKNVFWCSKEPSHRDVSFEYPQYMFCLRNKETNFQLPTLIWGSVKAQIFLSTHDGILNDSMYYYWKTIKPNQLTMIKQSKGLLHVTLCIQINSSFLFDIINMG